MVQRVVSWKEDKVKSIKELLQAYPVVGVAGIRGISARQLQSIRSGLRDKVVLKVCRNNILRIAIEEKKLSPFVEDQASLILTHENPFTLYKLLEKSKTPAPIKPGEIAPKDIEIEKGPTHFKPGPIVGELQHAGIPASIEGGRVVIKESKIVAERGEVISEKLSEMLSRLDIYPMETGLDLRAVNENDVIYDRELLLIDESVYKDNLISAAGNAFELAMNIVFTTNRTVQPLLQKAFINAHTLALVTPIFEPEVINDIIFRAYSYTLLLYKIVKEEKMEYVYAALLLHDARKEVNEGNICAILEAAGIEVDVARARSLVSALEGVDIEGAISTIPTTPTAVSAPSTAVEAEEKEKEEKKKKVEDKEEKAEESGMEGLSALFG
jgi:large subunit ribosomal protein L10